MIERIVAEFDEQLTSRWVRLGALFNTAPARRTPDLERLLLDTARSAHRNIRLFIMAGTWLLGYSDYLAKRRLAALVREELEPEFQPVLGLLLETVQEISGDDRVRARFRDAIAECRPAEIAKPLLDVNKRNPALRELSQQRASSLSRKWGRWLADFQPKFKALRPLHWIAEHNPSLAIRALTGGDLVASIAADAMHGHADFASESALARRYGASRSAIRDALRKLKLAGYAEQFAQGRAQAISLEPSVMTA